MPQPHNRELEQLEDKLKFILADPDFEELAKEYHRMLNILGNVEGDEVIALVILAMWKEGWLPAEEW